jgi:hypothetical protein
VAWVVGLVGLGALLAGLQLVPLAEATGESIRIAWADQGFDPILQRFAIGTSNLDRRLLGAFGAPGLVLIAAGIWTGGAAARAWSIAFGFAFFATTWPLSLMYEVYPYRLFRFAWGWLHLAPFFAAVLAALAVDRLGRMDPSRGRPQIAAGIALSVAALAGVYREWGELAIALGCALAAVLRPSRRLLGAFAGGLAVAQAALGFQDVTVRRDQRAPDLEIQAVRAARLNELRRTLPNDPRIFGETELRAGSFVADRLPSPLGHEAAVPPRRVARLVRSIGMWKVFGHPRDPGALWRGMAEHPGVMAALGLGIVTGTEQEVRPLMAAGYRRVARFEHGGVAVYREPLPRVTIHHHVVTGPDEDATFALVTRPDFDPFREVVVEAADPIEVGQPVPGASETVELIVDEPERVGVRVRLAAPGVVLLRDAQYPGWSVRVDGAQASSLTANHAFRAVRVEAGEHRIEWRYRPGSVLVGAGATALGILAWLGLARRLLGPGRPVRGAASGGPGPGAPTP